MDYEIDWNKEPEAEYYVGGPKYYPHWVKAVDGRYLIKFVEPLNYQHTEWFEKYSNGKLPDCAVDRPKEELLNDHEMFTVGNEIEYSFNNGSNWYKCVITYIVGNSGVVAKCYPDIIKDKGVEWYLDFENTMFRPIEKSAEERNSAVQKMLGYTECIKCEFEYNLQKKVCENLYDAGYRLVDEE
ncbi:hypothetical protein D3C85_580830 [compost metagenome]